MVGHVPLELSKIVKNFIRHGGTVTATVTDEKLHRSNRALGLIIYCNYKFSSTDEAILKLCRQLVFKVIADQNSWVSMLETLGK